MFPEHQQVEEFKRLVVQDVLNKVFRDMNGGNGKSRTAEEILGGPLTPANIDAYQRHLGLAELPEYGGDTTCLSIETSDGEFIVLDGGSGIRNCSKYVMQTWPANKPRELYLFGTHEHLDHRSGLPFSQFCFVTPPFTLNILGSYQFLRALDERYGIFCRQVNSSTHVDDPIDFHVMTANFRGIELRNPSLHDAEKWRQGAWEVRDSTKPVQIGKTTIHCFEVYHGQTRCLAYKIEHGDVKFVFCTDHELRHGPDATDPREARSAEAEARLIENCQDVDLAYFDGQYFLEEYWGKRGIGTTSPVSRVDWGHGCVEDAVARSKRCRIKRTLIGHHDPERSWVSRLELDRWLQKYCEGQPYKVELAKSEEVIDL